MKSALVRLAGGALLAAGLVTVTPTTASAVTTNCSVWEWTEIPSVVMRTCHREYDNDPNHEGFVQVRNVGAYARIMRGYVKLTSADGTMDAWGDSKTIAPDGSVVTLTREYAWHPKNISGTVTGRVYQNGDLKGQISTSY